MNNFNKMKKLIFIIAFTLTIGLLNAQSKIGGHFGAVHPLVTFSEGQSTSIADNYVIGFPAGITVKFDRRLAFDVEFVPFIDNGRMNELLFHPGILLDLGGGFTLGNRLAFETSSTAYGFTPLLNKAFNLGENGNFFTKLVLPVRFGEKILESGMTDNFSAFTIGLHTGIAF